MIKIKIVFYCFSFRCEEAIVECTQAENLTWSGFRVKILWSTGEIFFLVYLICRMSVECELT